MQFISLINSLQEVFISEGRGKRYLFQREGKIADCGLLPKMDRSVSFSEAMSLSERVGYPTPGLPIGK